MQTNEVHGIGLGEREGLADEAGQALTEGVVEALDMVGRAGVFADGPMLFVGEHGPVSPPKVGVDDATPVAVGDCPPQALAGCLAATTDHARHDLPGSFA